MIDQRAIVDSKANIDESVDIGPFSIIGPDVEIQAGTWIGPHVVITGNTSIGQDNQIYQFASVGEAPQDKKYQGEATKLVIGNRNVIREYATLHRGTIQDQGMTQVGNDNLLMAYSHIAHDCQVADHVILANASSLAGHVKLHHHAILGGFTVVHQFCHIGAYAFSAMGCVITRDVPPYTMLGGRPTKPYGINIEGLKRNQFSDEAIRMIRKAFKLIYRSKLTLEQAIDEVAELSKQYPELDLYNDFFKSSQRSILR